MTDLHSSRRHTTVTGRLGELTLAADEVGLTGVWFDGHWHPPTDEQLGRRTTATDATLAQAVQEIDEYLDGSRTQFEVPISLHGNAFQLQVWRRIRAIPFGSRTTYGAIARELGSVGLSQRVGQCVGHNPISVIVPCHRVVGADGSLTGYAGGLERKQFLLDLESDHRQERLF